MPYLNEAGLSYYDPKLKEWIGDQPVKTIPSTLYPWTLTEKAGAVTCWPVGGADLKPTVDFLFTETGPASGDKGPENPSTISGVTQVKVTRCGRNLALSRSTTTSNGVTCTANGDGTYTVNGQATGGMAQFPLITAYSKLPIATGDWVTVSGCPSGGSTSTYSTYLELRDKNAVWKASRYDTGGTPVPFEATEDGYLTYSILIKEGASVSNLLFKPQMEFGTVATEFEKPEYNDYPLPLGNTYYGGEIDLATGLMTVTWESNVFTSIYSYAEALSNTVKVFLRTTKRNLGGFGASYNTCNKIPTITDSSDMEHIRTSGSNGSFDVALWLNKSRLDISSAVNPSSPTSTEWADAVNAWLADNPLLFVYELSTPYTIQLTPTSILSLPQADKYTPRLNTVYTDAQSVQISYVKSPIREEYELQQAIVSQGGSI